MKKQWWAVLAGVSALCAFYGAVVHDLFLLLWNMAWLGYDLYMYERAEE